MEAEVIRIGCDCSRKEMETMNKSENVLLIFYKFLSEKRLSKDEVMKECTISSLTFARYLADIRNFLDRNLPCYEVMYDKKENIYYLKLNSSCC